MIVSVEVAFESSVDNLCSSLIKFVSISIASFKRFFLILFSCKDCSSSPESKVEFITPASDGLVGFMS